MEKRRLFIVAGLTLIAGLGILLATKTQTDAQDCRIVRIHAGGEADAGKILLEPDTMWIDPKTCVIWSNWVGGKIVSIRFSEGKKCEANTTAPTLFKMDDQNCYVSSYVEYAGTTSLTFKEVGTYRYVVDAEGMESTKGSIVVR